MTDLFEKAEVKYVPKSSQSSAVRPEADDDIPLTPSVIVEPCVELVKASQEFGLEKNKAEIIVASFNAFTAVISDWEKQEAELVISGIDDKVNMKKAKEGRLYLKKIRCQAENKRKKDNEDSLKEQKTRNAVAGFITTRLQKIEDNLKAKEDYAEKMAKQAMDKLIADRTKTLEPYGIDLQFYRLGDMSEIQFQQLVDQSKLLYDAKLKKQKEDEEARIAEEKRVADEAEKKRVEDERLKKEKEELEAKLEKERKEKEELRLENERKENERIAKQKLEQEERDKIAKEQKEREDKLKKDAEDAIAREEKLKKEAEESKLREEKAKKDAEEAQKKADEEKKEAERKSEENRRNAEANKRLAEEQRKKAEKAEAEKLELEKELKEKQDKEDKERARVAEAERKAKEEEEKRKTAPDREKLATLILKLNAIEYPELQSAIGIQAVNGVKSMMAKVTEYINIKIAKLG